MGGQLGEMSLMVDEYKSRVGNLSVYIGLLDLFPAISSLKEITPSSGVEGYLRFPSTIRFTSCCNKDIC